MQKFKPAESAKQIRPGIQVYTVDKNPEKKPIDNNAMAVY